LSTKGEVEEEVSEDWSDVEVLLAQFCVSRLFLRSKLMALLDSNFKEMHRIAMSLAE